MNELSKSQHAALLALHRAGSLTRNRGRWWHQEEAIQPTTLMVLAAHKLITLDRVRGRASIRAAGRAIVGGAP